VLEAAARRPLNLRELVKVRKLPWGAAKKLIDRMRYHGLLSQFRKRGVMHFEPGTAGKRALQRRK